MNLALADLISCRYEGAEDLLREVPYPWREGYLRALRAMDMNHGLQNPNPNPLQTLYQLLRHSIPFQGSPEGEEGFRQALLEMESLLLTPTQEVWLYPLYPQKEDPVRLRAQLYRIPEARKNPLLLQILEGGAPWLSEGSWRRLSPPQRYSVREDFEVRLQYP